MTQDEPTRTWPASWTAAIGDAIAQLRAEQKISARELSERCSALGYEVPRNTIANLEAYRKRDILLSELVVIAAALRVPPARLLAPVLDDDGQVVDEVELLPGVKLSPLLTLKWISGEWRLPYEDFGVGQDDDDDVFEVTTRPLRLLREHTDLEARLLLPLDPSREASDLRQLVRVRAELRRLPAAVPAPRNPQLAAQVEKIESLSPAERTAFLNARDATGAQA